MKKVEKLSNRLVKSGRTICMAGIGATVIAGEQAKTVFNGLVEKGKQRAETQGAFPGKGAADALVKRVKDAGGSVASRMEAGVKTLIGKWGVPSQEEIQALSRSVEQLTKKVQNLQTQTPAKA